MTRLGNDAEIEQLVMYLSKIPLDHPVKPEEFGYNNPVLICLDAVLSINRKYAAFVVPRIKHFQENYAQICTLKGLAHLLRELGYDGFHVVWQYRHTGRAMTLERLLNRYIEYADVVAVTDDLTAMKDWATKSSVMDYRTFRVRGIGLATFQYLRMMLGVSTVKPDVHIKRAVSMALNRPISDLDAIWLVERASERMGLPATLVDHNLWRSFASDTHLLLG
ncbi:MAG TPA: hypothetical protein VLH56_01650 [Dissulfurispiraceae bacterium]|nr:hypothetical protein [Dissulfurispiraceae bacterium]